MKFTDISKKCDFIIKERSKTWLAEKLGKTMPTLNSRLSGVTDWRYNELAIIEEAYAVIQAALEMESNIVHNVKHQTK